MPHTDLPIPIKALDQHLVVLGKTGAGKSSALRVLVEHLLDRKKRVCIVDPKGDWWGLKSSADGKHAGYPVIMFGDFKNADASDVPINELAGKQIAELIATGNRPCVIGFRGWMTGRMVQFWIDFAATLFSANAGELYLVIDEVHHFAPKGKIQDPQAGKCLHWSNRLMNEGRGIGLVNLIASQRPQKVHNDTLTACETLVAMRVIHKADRDAVEDWIKGCGDPVQGRDVLNALANMARGDAFVWSPEIGFGPTRLSFPLFRTFDSFAPPQLQRAVSARSWADVDLGEVRQKLSAIIERAKADDPKELRREIAELKHQLRTAKTEAPAPPAAKPMEVPVIKPDELKRLEKICGDLEKYGRAYLDYGAGLTGVARELDAHAGHLRAALQTFARTPRPPTPVLSTPRAAAPAVRARTAAPAASADNGEISGVEQRILDALAELEVLGAATPERVQVAFLAGYTNLSSKGFANAMGSLRSKALIDYPTTGKLVLTEAGRNAAHFPDAPRSSEEIQDRVIRMLGGTHGRILEPLLRAYPNALAREELARQANYTNLGSKGFANAIGRLRTLGFITYPTRGEVAAAAVLFL